MSMIEELVRFRSNVKAPEPLTPHQEKLRGLYLAGRIMCRHFTGKLEHETYSPADGPGAGLECCRVCGGFEAGLAEFCPGFKMNRIESELVYWVYCNGPNSAFGQLAPLEDYNAAAMEWNNELFDLHLMAGVGSEA